MSELKLRPSPVEPDHSKLSPAVAQYVANVRDWAREVERALRTVIGWSAPEAHSIQDYVNPLVLDFAGDGYRSITLAGNIEFLTANKAAPRRLTLRIIGDGSSRNYTFPGWTFMGTAPTALAAGKTALLTLICFGSLEADVVAVYSVEA